MAFGQGAGASTPQASQSITSAAQSGWGDASTRVIAVLVLGIPLIALQTLAGGVATAQGKGNGWLAWIEYTITGIDPVSPPNGAGALSGTVWGELGMLGILVILAAISEGAGALAVTILAALWVAWLVSTGGVPFAEQETAGSKAPAKTA